jgi:hypothetical protein
MPVIFVLFNQNFNAYTDLILYILRVGRDSSVSIATGYGLDCPGIESRSGARFFAHVHTGLGAHSASCTMGVRVFPGEENGRGVVLTTHLHLAPRSRMSRAIPLLPIWVFEACYRANCTFYILRAFWYPSKIFTTAKLHSVPSSHSECHSFTLCIYCCITFDFIRVIKFNNLIQISKLTSRLHLGTVSLSIYLDAKDFNNNRINFNHNFSTYVASTTPCGVTLY